MSILFFNFSVFMIIFFFLMGSRIRAPNRSHWAFHDQCGVDCVDSKLDNDLPEEYLIHTPKCIIPSFPPDHPSVAKYRRKTPVEVTCGSRDDLTEDDEDRRLRVRLDRLEQYGVTSLDWLNCSYQGIVRVNDSDRKQKLKMAVAIKEEVTSIEDEDAILVTCTRVNDIKQRPIYRNIHYFIQPRIYEEKQKRYKNSGSTSGRRGAINVLMIGKDAVSRWNLLRHMPRTYEYLTNDLGGIDFRGFNKIGHNTFPNMISTMLGFPYWELQNNDSCCPSNGHKLNDCPFIWKLYSEKNYVTYYLEDAPWMGTFRYVRKGFVEQPTDIYNGAYAFMSDKYLGHNSGMRGFNGKICQGRTLTTKVLHDYVVKIAKALEGKVPYFGLVWEASLTHDSLSMASTSDEPTLAGLKALKDGGHLENTFLILLSDHGIMYGDIRSTYAGVLEERLPILVMVPPPWFQYEYPEAHRNLQINSRRLVSNLDIYATLQDLHNLHNFNLNKSFVGERYGQSLFQEVPLNRTCEDVAIQPHFCTCQDTQEVDPHDPQLLAAANFSINHINKGLAKFNQCVQLTLDKVTYGRVNRPTNSTTPAKQNTIATKYLVMFTAKPSGALLESSVHYMNGTFKILTEVSRINAYKGQSHCIQDFVYRMYCFCKDLLH